MLNLTPSTTYYVRASQGGVSGSTFTVCATAPLACAAPSNFYLGIITTNTAPLVFSPALGNTSYTATYTALGGTPQTATFGGLPYTLTNLLPGTPYTVSLVANCGGGLVSAPVVATFNTLISNDNPCGAVALPAPGTTCAPTGATTSGASGTVPNGYPSQGCGFGNNSDVWFTFTTAATGPASTGATITVPDGVSKQVRVFAASSCNGPFTQLGCAASVPGTNALKPEPRAGPAPDRPQPQHHLLRERGRG